MLSQQVIDEARRLLSEGRMSQRQIAERLHISRGTVNSLALGRRGSYGRETATAQPIQISPSRCPGCRALVYMPCVLCRTRRFIAERKIASQGQLLKRVA
jgi:transcriptional regulator with XRE-family HTH domain